ncbi:MAG: beta/gamma crystallin-related protein [Bacteroidota bacterium]
MARKFFLTACCAFFILVAAAQNYVTLYEDCNFRGRSYFLEPGQYRGYQMKMDNDRLSSMQVPAGMKITIYEHDNFNGKSKTYTSNIYCLDELWNDMASSMVVESTFQPGYNANDYIVFYNDCYSKGYSRSLGPGTYSGNQLGSLRQNISSFMIYGNLRVRVYTSSDIASGYYGTFDATQSCLSSTFNDRIRSLVIEYNPGAGYGGGNYGGGYYGNNYATVYTECSYRGNSLRLAPGYYQGDKLGLLKYNISSIEIPSNLTAKVYINNEYMGGSYYILNESYTCLSSTMNNRIGSLIIEEKEYYNNNNNNYYPPDANQRVVIYVDEDYRGQSVSLLPGTYSSMSQIGFPDDALSSLTVPAGYRVVIYEHENFRGKNYTITASKTKFYISGWSDKTSSIAVYRDR